MDLLIPKTLNAIGIQGERDTMSFLGPSLDDCVRQDFLSVVALGHHGNAGNEDSFAAASQENGVATDSTSNLIPESIKDILKQEEESRKASVTRVFRGAFRPTPIKNGSKSEEGDRKANVAKAVRRAVRSPSLPPRRENERQNVHDAHLLDLQIQGQGDSGLSDKVIIVGKEGKYQSNLEALKIKMKYILKHYATFRSYDANKEKGFKEDRAGKRRIIEQIVLALEKTERVRFLSTDNEETSPKRRKEHIANAFRTLAANMKRDQKALCLFVECWRAYRENPTQYPKSKPVTTESEWNELRATMKSQLLGYAKTTTSRKEGFKINFFRAQLYQETTDSLDELVDAEPTELPEYLKLHHHYEDGGDL